MNKPPESDLIMALLTLISDYRMYILMALMGAWGAVVKHLEAVKKGLRFQWLDVHIALFSGAFIGVVVGLAMKSLEVNDYVLYATIGIASNMGTVSLRLLANAMSTIIIKPPVGGGDDNDDDENNGSNKNGGSRRKKR